jgi:hypothetical protein
MTEDTQTTLIEIELNTVPALQHDEELALSISHAVLDVVRARYGTDDHSLAVQVRRFDIEKRGQALHFTKVGD